MTFCPQVPLYNQTDLEVYNFIIWDNLILYYKPTKIKQSFTWGNTTPKACISTFSSRACFRLWSDEWQWKGELVIELQYRQLDYRCDGAMQDRALGNAITHKGLLRTAGVLNMASNSRIHDTIMSVPHWCKQNETRIATVSLTTVLMSASLQSQNQQSQGRLQESGRVWLIGNTLSWEDPCYVWLECCFILAPLAEQKPHANLFCRCGPNLSSIWFRRH